MDLGRIKAGEKAIMVLNVDNQVSDAILQQITKIEGILDATPVKL
jgi:hypothetical protein